MNDHPFSKSALDTLVADSIRENPPAVSAPPPEAKKKGVSKWAQLATLGGHMADAGTTIHALNQGAMETNPLYGENPSAGKVLGMKGGTAALQMLLQHFLGKKNPTAANVLGYGTGAAMGGVAGWNMAQANKMKRNGGE